MVHDNDLELIGADAVLHMTSSRFLTRGALELAPAGLLPSSGRPNYYNHRVWSGGGYMSMSSLIDSQPQVRSLRVNCGRSGLNVFNAC